MSKENTNDNVIEVTQADVDASQETTPAVNDTPLTALSVVKDSGDNLWKVVKVAYNINTGKTTKPEVVYSDMHRMTVQEHFKILAARSFFSE